MSQNFGDILATSLLNTWGGVIEFLPRLIIALLVFIIGWIIAVVIGKAVTQIIRSVKVDKALQAAGVEEVLSKGGFKLDSGEFLGSLVKWFFIIVFLLTSADILNLNQVNFFLQQVLDYLPSVIVAILVLIIASFVSNLMQKLITGSAKVISAPSATFLGGIAKWAVWVFAILVALYHLGIAGVFAQTLFTGFVAMLAIAGGLAFGLGGKDAATKFIEKLRGDITHKG